MNRPLSLLFALVAAASPGCASPSDPPPPISFDMEVPVAEGAELHVCQLVKMPKSSAKIFVGGGSYTATAGTHHFLLFRTAADLPSSLPLDQPVDCAEGDGLMKYERGFVTGGQLASDSASFPPGAALPFASEETLLFQGHFLNTTGGAITAKIHVELDPVDASTVVEDVGTFRFYDPFIYVPPLSNARAQMRCHIHHDVVVLSAGSHMHERGVGYAAFLDPASVASAEPFFTTDDWQHPPFYYGPLSVSAGDSLRFQCDYANSSATAIVQGPSATDNEMCMLSAFYVPAQDDDENDCVSMDRHGTGTQSCAQTASCLELCPPDEAPRFDTGSADVGACFQQCIAESCPNVTAALFPELTCLAAKCSAPCASYGASCSACVADQCKEELDACQALACSN